MEKKVEVRSFGCSANFGEGEIIQGLLHQQNLEIVNDKSDALVLNLCTVKGNSSSLTEIRKAQQEDPQRKIIISGCVTKELAQEALAIDKTISVTTTHDLDNMDKIVEQSLAGTPFFNLKKKNTTRVQLPRIRSNQAIGIVPICSGCLDRCAFCSTVQVKGKLFSYAEEQIIAEVESLVADGAKEIWLTGQDAACYGFDTKTNIVELLNKLVLIPGEFFLRVGMGNPRHMMAYIDDLIAIMKHPKVFKFIHLPVQAGSSKVLSFMKRQHSVEDYLYLAQKLRAEIPEITISTDIIVGHPGEEEDDFLQTLDVLKITKPSVCNRTRFVPRQGTPAANMQQLPKLIKKDRSKRVTDLFKEIALSNNQDWMGWQGKIVIDEFGKAAGTRSGRNYAYKPVIVTGDFEFGEIIQVKVTGIETFCLLAEVLPV
jgi:MiaB-like tRNA modifying enzyme